MAMTLQQRLTFYVLVPLLPALPLGLYQAGYGKFLSPLGSVTLWSVTWLISWWGCELGSRLVAVALKPWRPPLLSVLVGGALLNMLASSFYHPVIVQWFLDPSLVAGTRRVAREFTSFEYLRLLALSGTSSTVSWTVANLVLERVTGITRFGDATHPRLRPPAAEAHDTVTAGSGRTARVPSEVPDLPVLAPVATPPAAVASPADAGAPTGPAMSRSSAPAPAILDRLERLKGLRAEDLHALEAEDHYVKVHGAVGSELVYYRFSDALRDVQALDGIRVHRSFWVSRAAVERVEKQGRHMELLLRSGLRIPVSAGFREIVRAALPVRDADLALRSSIAR
jgi:hypothetical protein